MPDASSTMNNEEINSIAKTVIENIIANEPYKHSDVKGWNDSIVEQITERLIENSSSYKYIVSCMIVQKNGAGISTTVRCYWNNNSDKFINVRWENKHLHCIVHIYVVSF